MDRRIFLKTGALATAAAAASSRGAQDQSPASLPVARMLQMSMIWSRQSVPIEVRKDGGAASIADAQKNVQDADLHTVFLKEFSLGAKPARAILHLFAYTRYRLYVNGRYAGRGPSRFQNQRPEYDTRELSPLLQAGNNVFAVLVHRDAPTGRTMRHAPGFALLLALQDAGGAEHTLGTDASWRSRPDLSFSAREVAWASIPEVIDARRMDDWLATGYDAGAWPQSVAVQTDSSFFPLWPRTTPLQQESRRAWLQAEPTAGQTLSGPAEVVFHLPEIVQGYHLLRFSADAGTTLALTYGLPQGADSGTNTYTARAGDQTYIGGDTFALDHLTLRVTDGTLILHTVEIYEVRYPFERVGSFRSSDPFLDGLWSLCARSIEVLSEDAYVDCADRERVEWTDNTPPAFGLTRTMMAGPPSAPGGEKTWSDPRLLKALLRRIALTQQPDGQIKAHSCSERWDIHAIMEDRSCDWVSSLRDYYESTGDIALVRELWGELRRLMQWFLDRRTPRGLVLAREWEVWDNPLRYQVCEGAGLNTFAYRALRDAASLARLLGQRAQSKQYDRDADALEAAFNTLLWDEQAGAYSGALFGPGPKMQTQLNLPMFTGPLRGERYEPTLQSALFALRSGIVPPTRIARVQQWVLAHQAQATGVMSCHYLFEALYAIDTEEQDTRVLAQMRSLWKSQVDSPWQTSWESLEDQGASKVHMYGALPGYFLSAYVLGVRRAAPVMQRAILVEPRCGDLRSASGVVVTEFGPVPIAWTSAADGAFSLNVTVPAGIVAQVRLRHAQSDAAWLVDEALRHPERRGLYFQLSLPAGTHRIITAL